jgi:uncharacterized damage-inducible protein DinB
MTWDADFRSTSTHTLLQHMGRIEVCVAKLSDDQIWARGHETENAVGNLCLHLAGNVRQWIISSLGGELDRRTRDAEFDVRSGDSGSELTARLRQTIDAAVAIIESLTPEQLAARYTIQNYEVSGLGVVFHVVEHFAQHTAQIIMLTKILTGTDLGFYRHLSGRISTQEGVHSATHSSGTGSVQVP